jgi:Kef-type K+ transport system membrane component KefB
MSTFIQLAVILILILLAAKVAGYISHRMGQPSILGELLVGLILGPSLLDITHLPFITDAHLTETVLQYGEFGVLLLMFLAGMELHLGELSKQIKVSAVAGSMGVVFPVLLGWLAGILLGMNTQSAIFLGLTTAATSVSISAQTLMEMKVLRTRVGLGLLGAAVFDDILVIIILSIFLALVNGGSSAGEILWIFVKIILFLIVSVMLGLWLLPLIVHMVNKISVSQGMLTLALIVMLVYGIGAELIGGMAAITGTFIAGLMFSRSPEKQRIEAGLHSIGYGFFIPIFFISIGLNLNLRTLQADTFTMWIILVVSGITGKLIGAGLGSRISGFSWRESFQLGAGMISRGEVGLIVASVGLTNNLLSPGQFSAIVGMIVVSTIVTPPLLRALFKTKDKQKLKSETVEEGA